MQSAWRLLAAQPGFAAVLLITLALGIGAPTAVFSVVHAVLLQPLPYPDAHRLVQFRIDARHPRGNAVFDALPAEPAMQWAVQSATLQALALYNNRALTLVTPDGPTRLSGIAATPNLFVVIGVRPLLGDSFAPTSVDTHQIVLSHATWREHFAADPAIIGRPILLDSELFLVRAVMPPEFQFPDEESRFWVPLTLTPGGSRGMLLPAIARMHRTATLPEVTEEGRRVLADGGFGNGDATLIVRTLHDQLVGPVERVVWVVFAAVGLVTVIATANLALLLLVRGAGRVQEFAIRLALGASRAQLFRQLAAEALVLSAIGGALGTVLAFALLGVLIGTAPPDVPRLREAAINAPVLLLALAITLLTGVTLAVLSTGRTLGLDVIAAWHRPAFASQRPTESPRRRMQLLASAELALTMVLLVAAGALLQSFVARALIDHGFDPRGAVALRVSLPPARYAGADARAAFHGELLEHLRRSAGADALGLATALPNRQPSGRFDFSRTPIAGPRDPLSMQIAEVRMATPGFIPAMGLRLRGRDFARSDVDGAERVVIISEQMARLHFPEGDAEGNVLYSGAAGALRVAGVVSDVRPADGREPSPAAYLPLAQNADVLQWFSSINVILRGADSVALADAVRTAVASLDREVPVYDVRPLARELAGLVAGPRYVATVLTAFATVALVIAAIGVYGVTAYSAARRTREIGIRIALGATRVQVMRTILQDGALVIVAGLALGVLAATWLSQLITGMLHDAPPVTAGALAGVGALLAASALLAAYLPTRRATRIAAVEALRQQ